jgi:hypothetical protein
MRRMHKRGSHCGTGLASGGPQGGGVIARHGEAAFVGKEKVLPSVPLILPCVCVCVCVIERVRVSGPVLSERVSGISQRGSSA